MIIIRSPRQDVEAIISFFFPVIKLQKETRINNVKMLDRLSDQYMGAIIFNCELTAIEIIFRKQQVNRTGKYLNIRFTVAQAAVFYKQLFILPIGSDHVYLNNLRNKWILDLEQMLIAIGLYEHEKLIEL